MKDSRGQPVLRHAASVSRYRRYNLVHTVHPSTSLSFALVLLSASSPAILSLQPHIIMTSVGETPSSLDAGKPSDHILPSWSSANILMDLTQPITTP